MRNRNRRSVGAAAMLRSYRTWLIPILCVGSMTASLHAAPPSPGKLSEQQRPLPRLFVPPPNGAVACTADRGDPQSTTGRDLDGYMYSDPAMTNDQCRNTCNSRGFVFAGTQFGSYCFCGAHFGYAGPSASCNMSCTGRPGEICGGTWANSISLSGAEPKKPQAPGNGLQCYIGIRASYEDPSRKVSYIYRQTEVQRWEMTGPPIPDGTGYRLPMRWTSTGYGTLHDDDGKGNVIESKWGISATHATLFAQKRWGQGWKISRLVTPPATVLDNIIESRQETINGVPQAPKVVKATATEYNYGDIQTYPLVSVQYDARGVYSPYQGYQHPMYISPVVVAGQCEGELHLGPP